MIKNIGTKCRLSFPSAEFPIIVIKINVVQIIIFTISEYLNEANNSDFFFEKSENAFCPPIHNAIKKEIISPRVAFPYTPVIAIVAKPSPVRITGIKNVMKIVKSPTGAPIK